MPITEGKDHDNLIYIEVYDTTIFGPEAQDELAQVLNDLHKASQMGLAELGQERQLAQFTKAFNELVQIINNYGFAINSPLTNEITFYSNALRKLDAAVQGDDALFVTELNEARNLAKRILKNFLLNPIEEKPEPEPAPEVSSTRQKITNLLARFMPGRQPDDK